MSPPPLDEKDGPLKWAVQEPRCVQLTVFSTWAEHFVGILYVEGHLPMVTLGRKSVLVMVTMIAMKDHAQAHLGEERV